VGAKKMQLVSKGGSHKSSCTLYDCLVSVQYMQVRRNYFLTGGEGWGWNHEGHISRRPP